MTWAVILNNFIRDAMRNQQQFAGDRAEESNIMRSSLCCLVSSFSLKCIRNVRAQYLCIFKQCIFVGSGQSKTFGSSSEEEDLDEPGDNIR